MDNAINAVKAVKRSRNHQGKGTIHHWLGPRLPPLPPGGKSKVKLTKLNIINNALEKAQEKARDLISIPMEANVIARSRELDNIAKAKDF